MMLHKSIFNAYGSSSGSLLSCTTDSQVSQNITLLKVKMIYLLMNTAMTKIPHTTQCNNYVIIM